MRPFSTIGWRTVVRGGLVHADAGTSSNPTTERSSGTRSPLACAAVTTPIAAISLIARTPVGRCFPFGSESKARAPAAPEMPARTECGAGAPAAGADDRQPARGAADGGVRSTEDRGGGRSGGGDV